MIQIIKTYSEQNLYDLALAGYSGFDNMVKMLVDNGINSINDQSVGVREITFDSNLNPDLTLNSVIQKRGYVFSTLNVGNYRITENKVIRITEDGSKRTLE